MQNQEVAARRILVTDSPVCNAVFLDLFYDKILCWERGKIWPSVWPFVWLSVVNNLSGHLSGHLSGSALSTICQGFGFICRLCSTL